MVSLSEATMSHDTPNKKAVSIQEMAHSADRGE